MCFYDASVWTTLEVALFIQVSVWHCFGEPRLPIELWGVHIQLCGLKALVGAQNMFRNQSVKALVLGAWFNSGITNPKPTESLAKT